MRVGVILAILLRNPSVISQFVSDLERMECQRPDLGQIRDAILVNDGADDVFAAVGHTIGAAPLENLLAERHVAITPAVRRVGDSELAVNSLKEEFAKLAARRGHLIELAEAEQDLAVASDEDEGLTWRVGRAALAVDPTTPRTVEDTTEVVVAENGLALRKEERDNFRKMVENLSMTKNGQRNS
jgi:DNA primase